MECFSSSVCGNRYGCPTGLQLFQTAKEQLGRGVVAIRENPLDVVVSWRYLSSDPINTSFNVYRNGEKIAEVPHSTGTFTGILTQVMKSGIYCKTGDKWG